MAVYFNSEINRRSANEDSFCDLKLRINHEAAVHVMAVADGMGGLTGGKAYSEAAVRIFNEKLLKLIMGNDFKGSSLFEQTELLKNFCRRVFQEINQELYTRGLDAGVKGGTTLTTVIRFWHNYIIANCGDSPVYYMKDGKLNLIADIQNAAWQMLIQGKTSLGSLLYCQNKTILLQYLGRREKVKPFVRLLPEEDTDCLLLGTDGAFGNLDRERMAGIIRDHPDGTELIDSLFAAAREDGEEDNQTAIFYRREGAGGPVNSLGKKYGFGQNLEVPDQEKPVITEYAGIYAESHAGTYAESHTETYAESHAGTYAENHTGAYAESHTGSYTENYTGPYAEPHANTHEGAYVEPHTGTYAESHADPYVDAYAKTHAAIYPDAYADALYESLDQSSHQSAEKKAFVRDKDKDTVYGAVNKADDYQKLEKKASLKNKFLFWNPFTRR